MEQREKESLSLVAQSKRETIDFARRGLMIERTMRFGMAIDNIKHHYYNHIIDHNVCIRVTACLGLRLELNCAH